MESTRPMETRILTERFLASLCGRRESTDHVLFQCKTAKGVWEKFPELRAIHNWGGSLIDRVELACQKLDKHWIALWLVLIWGLWKARNLRIFENKALSNSEIIEEAKILCKEINETEGPGAPNCNLSPGVSEWKLPENGWIKFNIDAAVKESGRCCIGFIGRDWQGVVCSYGARMIQKTGNVELAEAEALLWAVTVAVEMEITHVSFESDCLSLISKLRKDQPWRGQLGLVLQHIRRICLKFLVCKWVHVRRSANCAAHLVANSFSDFCVSFPSVSGFSLALQQTLFSDLGNE